MEPEKNITILCYTPPANAGRVKFFIPYALGAEREAFKKLDSSFYHYHQKLWSIVNTEANLKKVRELFGKKLVEIEEVAPAKIPQVSPSEKIQKALDENHQKMVLKGFSENTILSYQRCLLYYFSYFDNNTRHSLYRT